MERTTGVSPRAWLMMSPPNADEVMSVAAARNCLMLTLSGCMRARRPAESPNVMARVTAAVRNDPSQFPVRIFVMSTCGAENVPLRGLLSAGVVGAGGMTGAVRAGAACAPGTGAAGDAAAETGSLVGADGAGVLAAAVAWPQCGQNLAVCASSVPQCVQ